ncbi:ribonuclease HII [Agrococcus sp. ARC_14]|uniref:ribonuclease HII n=1 Tax=Agrococcus sp. ARC_14 TaxID=2919927 RepID=UPI001F055652|nr:ribonuclease HII [Agrococcus sp. ARC_14]MCH1882762.1 ribonuclease HII [Agrococcus sp. ARC_14]
MPVLPTLEVERGLWADASIVIGMDEVGRGALAGPVSVGALALVADCGEWPQHLRDSKTMTPLRRTATAPLVREWGVSAVGHASNDEIDSLGIQVALGLAGRRALVGLHEAGVDVPAAAILLDGIHDWLAPALRRPVRTVLRAKADRDCASVSGAALVAKVERDAHMVEVDAGHPGYGWASNKGYGSAAHLAAIVELGPTALHRHTWLHGIVPAGAIG